MAHRLLLGEPGSGKTTIILDEARSRLPRGEASFRVVVPTATMAEHLRNLLAREGFAVRPRTIVTLAGFLEELLPGVRAVPPALLSRLAARALAEARPAEFENFLGSPGFAAALSNTLEDLANAGCDALQWAALLAMGAAAGPTAHAIGAVYESLEREIARSGFPLRAAQLSLAAAAVRRRPPGALREIFWDGFFTFARAELELAAALASRHQTWIALPEWPGARPAVETLSKLGFRVERLGAVRKPPAVAAVSAPSAEDEAAEIALRLREEAARGRPWRDMGVILRGADPYVPLLRTTFARFGIPARFYFTRPLLAHPAARLAVSAAQALLSEWEHGLALECLLSPVTAAGQCPAAGPFRNRVCEGLPAKGLDGLRRAAAGLAGAEPVQHALSRISSWSSWTGGSLLPAEWAARLAAFEELVAPPSSDDAPGPEAVQRWRERASALSAVRDALSLAARSLPPAPVSLEVFWSEAHPVLAATSLAPSAARRDAVAVMDVHEARQWELPVVFLCGLLEGQFPRAASPDPIFGEQTRLRLLQSGLALRTRADREHEEQFLFRLALTRSTEKLVLSWPAAGDSGEPTLRSFALDALPFGWRLPEPAAARRAAVRPWREVPPPPRPAIQRDELLIALRRRHASLRATGIESFLQCPFRFFAGQTLGLEPVPPAPALRLTPLVEGVLIHSVIAAWRRGEGPLLTLLEREWRETLRRHRIPEGFRAEFSRALLERSLRFYEQKASVPPGWQARVEQPVRLALSGVVVEGRIDRYDAGPNGECAVYDYKFTGASRRRDLEKKQAAGLLVQGGLYAAALRENGLQPVSFQYVGLRGDTHWGNPVTGDDLAALIEDALNAASAAAFQIHQGEISVRPADAEACRYCDYLSACRVAESAAAVPASE